ncbi:hypothetical protein CROQUDRAFT_693283 [Cronartium quercuum f. sp. fusiforme G11]|uniref:Uncharacterized protein n=1 Tax=Cronartium quercuum f. sp. fusiforme G11 TaxID=708437 RepID=A0A9P6N9U2_9BASI|nr:hypothetical protein CROQUDRAFT_693283 [Cronartium quercuum f. sp. fusiforme G11]
MTPTGSAKRIPNQVIEVEWPEGFKSTKVSSFIWHMKIGKGIVNIKEFFILYSQAMLAKIGICHWGPDLDAADDTLWNKACQISAICIFQQWVSANAFAYMNINKRFTNDIGLLNHAYNHYVHYWIAQKYKQETKEEGKNVKDNAQKTIQRAQQHLCKARWTHAVAHKFSKRYQKILGIVEVHSNDEYNSKCKAYIVKTLVYQSAKANLMIRQVDDHMNKSAQIAGKQMQGRI